MLVLIGSCILALIQWWRWLSPGIQIVDFGRAPVLRTASLLVLPCCLALLFAGLKRYASHDVRDDASYLFFYLMLGAAWLSLAHYAAGCLGLNLRDDWLERRNPAAAVAGTGLLVGVTCSFAGANFGDGPGWWVVLFSGILSTGALFVCWWLYDVICGATEQIVLERDVGASLRFAGLVGVIGLVTGRAAAGNWISAAATVADFARISAPLLPVTIGAALIETGLRSSRPTPWMNFAFLTVYAGVAALCLKWAGPW